MLNEFAGIRKISDESLGRDETPHHTSHEILYSSQVFDNFLKKNCSQKTELLVRIITIMWKI